ncbi:MAG TPA: HAMP domain-containing sensor histidine kinase [Vicinamibacterales bacterium]|jgi:two-component system sensor histidine kinase BaeS
MSELVWYKSLYWRIGFGFIATLAVLLIVQVLIFFWFTDRIVGSSSRTPEQLVVSVASELSDALSSNPNLTLDSYVRDRFSHIYRPFLVVMRDGRTASNRPNRLPPNYSRAVQGRLRRGIPLRDAEPFDGGRRGGDGGPGPGPGPGRPGEGPSRGSEVAAIVVAGSEIGWVVVPIAPPPEFVAIRELGPTLTWVGLALLAVGAASAALLIFGPAHRRLRTLEQAARALGHGQTDVRAAEGGGDEVSSLAHTFNRMADDLSARAAALSASDRARRQLLADVSHELMTPLAAIRGYTETLSMPEVTLDNDTQQRYLGIIGDETMKLEALIGDLLDLARVEGGGGTLTIEEVPVRELFGRIADRHGPTIRDRRIALELDVRPPDLTVDGDAQKLEQALQNLAANALRHTPEGGRLSIAAQATADEAIFTVRDTGSGIPPEHLPHVFERFYKVDPSRTTTSHAGSGLGLSIVRAIVERHGGRVTASNAPDGGAMFEIRIPRSNRPPSD